MELTRVISSIILITNLAMLSFNLVASVYLISSIKEVRMLDLNSKSVFVTSKGELADGFYREDSFYCVATEGRTSEEIADIEEHEKCHALIYREPEHFCD